MYKQEKSFLLSRKYAFEVRYSLYRLCQESNLHAEHPSDLKFIALTTLPPRQLYNLSKASLDFLS